MTTSRSEPAGSSIDPWDGVGAVNGHWVIIAAAGLVSAMAVFVPFDVIKRWVTRHPRLSFFLCFSAIFYIAADHLIEVWGNL